MCPGARQTSGPPESTTATLTPTIPAASQKSQGSQASQQGEQATSAMPQVPENTDVDEDLRRPSKKRREQQSICKLQPPPPPRHPRPLAQADPGAPRGARSSLRGRAHAKRWQAGDKQAMKKLVSQRLPMFLRRHDVCHLVRYGACLSRLLRFAGVVESEMPLGDVVATELGGVVCGGLIGDPQSTAPNSRIPFL